MNEIGDKDRLRFALAEFHESRHAPGAKRKQRSFRTLIIGASGQVGASLLRLAEDDEVCLGTYCHHAQRGLVHLDLRDGSAVKEMILELRPQVCYLAGALTFVDYAESHPDECRQINVEGVFHVARAMAEIGGLLAYFSTEHVFADSTQLWREDDPVAPESAYAKSKAEAEQLIREILPDSHLILRTSWVFGPDPQEKNFVFRARRTLEEGEHLIVPSDQHGQPTYAPDLAQTAHELSRFGARGTYHVVGPQYLSRFDWAHIIAKALDLRSDLIQGTPTSDLARYSGNATSRPAPRPLHIRLDRAKLLSLLGYDPIRSPQAGVEETISGPRLPAQGNQCVST